MSDVLGHEIGLNIRIPVVVCVLIGLASTAGAAEVLTARVDRVEDRYHVDFVVIIDGAVEPLRELVTDYARLDQLSPTVVSSRVLTGRSGGDARVEVKLRPCVMLVLCKTITKVSDARVEPDTGQVRYMMVPGLGDFHQGRETITMTQASTNGTPRVRFRYVAELHPDFYIPPVVGTWLIRRAIVNDLETTSRRVERLMQQDGSR